MSVKDQSFGANCPICGDYLPGSDDAVLVYDCLKGNVEDGCACGCDICGEECSLDEAKEIVAKGPPDTSKGRKG